MMYHAHVLLALCASALHYDSAQLESWWNISAAGPGDCRSEDACPRPVGPAPRVALLLRGEAFRASAAQHSRDTCTKRCLWRNAFSERVTNSRSR